MGNTIIPCSENYFTGLAKYYDVTHQWRNYDLQASFIQEIIRVYKKDCRDLLDLACGTGEHALRLCKAGYKVSGVDNSKEMLNIASSKEAALSPAPEWLLGDLMTLESEKYYDIAYCLGMTIHYIYSHQVLASLLSKVKEMLRPAGIFVIDIINPWRILDWDPVNNYNSKDSIHNVYILERSQMDYRTRIRHNDYTWFVHDSGGRWGKYEVFENLKTWFIDEIERFLAEAGFKLMATCSDYTMGRLNLEKDFNIVFVAESC